MFARASFLPTLAYNLLQNRWSSWNWYDRMDETIVLGALPFSGAVTQKLLLEENIRAVISMNEDFELSLGVSNGEYWKQIGIPFLQLNTLDLFHSPTQEKLEEGVAFILSHQEKVKQGALHCEFKHVAVICPSTQPSVVLPWSIQNDGALLEGTYSGEKAPNNNQHRPSIYIHCKAGRTRSATLVACYLITRYGLTPEEAVAFMRKRRTQVYLYRKQWQAIEEYYRHHRRQRQERFLSQEAHLQLSPAERNLPLPS